LLPWKLISVDSINIFPIPSSNHLILILSHLPKSRVLQAYLSFPRAMQVVILEVPLPDLPYIKKKLTKREEPQMSIKNYG